MKAPEDVDAGERLTWGSISESSVLLPTTSRPLLSSKPLSMAFSTCAIAIDARMGLSLRLLEGVNRGNEKGPLKELDNNPREFCGCSF